MDAGVVNWLYSVMASAASAAALIGLAGYLGRAQLSHWLNKDLESAKAAHQKDLEAYKVTLIAEVERVKASRDVQKTMALKIAEKRFDSIVGLHKALAANGISNVSATIVAAHETSSAERLKYASELTAGLAQIGSQLDMASPFLAIQDSLTFRKYVSELADLVTRFRQDVYAHDPNYFEEKMQKAIEAHVACNRIVETHMHKLFSMDE